MPYDTVLTLFVLLSATCRSKAKASPRIDGLPAAADKAVETPLASAKSAENCTDSDSDLDSAEEDDNRKVTIRKDTPKATKGTSQWSTAQLQLERENHDKKHFINEQKASGNMQDGDTIAHRLRCTVRETIFASVKFANQEKFFDYLPVQGKDWQRGIFFRAVKKGCSIMPSDEESWWYKQRRAVREALKSKRATVHSGLKCVMKGE
jgi:hypothetical protein